MLSPTLGIPLFMVLRFADWNKMTLSLSAEFFDYLFILQVFSWDFSSICGYLHTQDNLCKVSQMEILVDKSIFGVVGWRGGRGLPGLASSKCLDLKKCSFVVIQPTQHWRLQLIIFYWTSKTIFLELKTKTFPKVTGYFVNIRFYSSNACLNWTYVLFPSTKHWTHGFKFQSILFSL